MKKLIIIGASGFGREVAWLVERINQRKKTWDLLGFVDDNPQIHNTSVGGYTVLGGWEVIQKYADVWVVCAIGSAAIRKKIIQRVNSISATNFATLIDPSVLMSNRVAIGEGSIICAGSILTVDVMIGSHVIVNLDCTIAHDSIIKNFATLYPSVNVSGATKIEECAEIGTGTQIIQGKTIGAGAIIGAGAVVVQDVKAGGTYVGVPARKCDT